MDSIHNGKRDSRKGVTKGTTDKITGSFAKWTEFATEAGLDIFLRDCELPSEQIFSGFAHQLRHNFAGKTSRFQLRGCTVRQDINNVSATFRENGHDDPVRTKMGKLYTSLNRQLNGYIADDSPPRQQCPLPISIFHPIVDDAHTSLDIAGADLICGALFFGMRSCEYTHTPRSEEKKTALLELRDISFRDKKGNTLSHRSQQLLHHAYKVTIMFRQRKIWPKDGENSTMEIGKKIMPSHHMGTNMSTYKKLRRDNWPYYSQHSSSRNMQQKNTTKIELRYNQTSTSGTIRWCAKSRYPHQLGRNTFDPHIIRHDARTPKNRR